MKLAGAPYEWSGGGPPAAPTAKITGGRVVVVRLVGVHTFPDYPQRRFRSASLADECHDAPKYGFEESERPMAEWRAARVVRHVEFPTMKDVSSVRV